jgi:hypothetical protein
MKHQKARSSSVMQTSLGRHHGARRPSFQLLAGLGRVRRLPAAARQQHLRMGLVGSREAAGGLHGILNIGHGKTPFELNNSQR